MATDVSPLFCGQWDRKQALPLAKAAFDAMVVKAAAIKVYPRDELLEVDDAHVAQVWQVRLQDAMRRQPVLDEADNGVGRERTLATVLDGPRLRGVSVAHRMSKDDDKVCIWVERLQVAHPE